MSRDDGSERTQRTVAELLAQHGGGSDPAKPRRRRRRADDATDTAPQAIIDRVVSDTGRFLPVRDEPGVHEPISEAPPGPGRPVPGPPVAGPPTGTGPVGGGLSGRYLPAPEDEPGPAQQPPGAPYGSPRPGSTRVPPAGPPAGPPTGYFQPAAPVPPERSEPSRRLGPPPIDPAADTTQVPPIQDFPPRPNPVRSDPVRPDPVTEQIPVVDDRDDAYGPEDPPVGLARRGEPPAGLGQRPPVPPARPQEVTSDDWFTGPHQLGLEVDDQELTQAHGTPLVADEPAGPDTGEDFADYPDHDTPAGTGFDGPGAGGPGFGDAGFGGHQTADRGPGAEPDSGAVDPDIDADAGVTEDVGDVEDEDAEASAARSPVKEWLAMIGQLAAGVVGGAGLWLVFQWLWRTLPAAALVAALAVVVCLVIVVRKIRRSDDVQTIVLTVFVGLIVTVSPAALLLVGQ